eukprot:m.373489 g.373489  ORF g.373489 m.373489 type:complete len:128 (-) comp56151_c0_seq2:63-446(-)
MFYGSHKSPGFLQSIGAVVHHHRETATKRRLMKKSAKWDEAAPRPQRAAGDSEEAAGVALGESDNSCADINHALTTDDPDSLPEPETTTSSSAERVWDEFDAVGVVYEDEEDDDDDEEDGDQDDENS